MKSLIALSALLAPSTQTPPPPPCVTPAEVEHAVLFLLPTVMDGLAEQCRTALPTNAYLLTGGAEMSKRLSAERNVHWDAARGAIVRFAGEEKAGALAADTASLMIRDLFKAEASKNVPTTHCAGLNRALELLAPLPPQNIAALVSLVVETGAKADIQGKLAPAPKGKKAAKPAPSFICPAAPPAPAPGQ